MKRLYVMQTGEMSRGHDATSAGVAFRSLLRWAKAGLKDCGPLVRFRYKTDKGNWSEWFYQDPRALKQEP